MSKYVRITDVSPRDGLQNEPGVIPTADKVRLVELLCATGVDEIEVTSFVSPKWVPQLGDAAEVLAGIANIPRPLTPIGHHPLFSALVPNDRGLDSAIAFYREELGHAQLLHKISVFTAASETFCRKNTNASIDETLDRFRAVLRRSTGRFAARAYISCVIACPFEGAIDPTAVARIAGDLWEMGVEEIDLGDTIGAGTPENVAAMLTEVNREMSTRLARPTSCWNCIVFHPHDTFGHAAECVKVALDMGVRSFDGSVAGLGGCPYASKKLPDGTIQRAPGNISTETLVKTIHEAGYKTRVDLDKLGVAAEFAREVVAKSRRGGGA